MILARLRFENFKKFLGFFKNNNKRSKREDMNNLLCSFWLIDFLWLIILGAILIALIVLVVIFVPLKLWFKALISGARVSMIKLASLKAMKVDVDGIVKTYITARKAGIFIDIDELQTHLSAGGHIDRLINALIMAKSFKIDVSVDSLKAIDLSGKDVVELIRSSINPKIKETEKISGVTRDGIEVKIKFKVGIKANLINTFGALSEENIFSKISENAVSIVSGYENYADVANNLEDVSKMLLIKDLDEGSSFKIVSIEVSHIEIGDDFGARARASKIEEDRLRLNMEDEHERNQMALEEQKMKVKVQEMNVEKVKAEMDLPKALAKSVSDGKIDIMDYYKMQNIIADTNMRKAITNASDEEKNKNTYLKDDGDDDSF